MDSKLAARMAAQRTKADAGEMIESVSTAPRAPLHGFGHGTRELKNSLRENSSLFFCAAFAAFG